MPIQCPPSPHLDTGEDSLSLEDIHKLDTFVRGLVERLLEHDGAGNVLAQARSGVEELAPGTAVIFCVLYADRVEALASGGIGLVRCENASPAGGDLLGSGAKLLLEGIGGSIDGKAGADAGSTGAGSSLRGGEGD